MFLSFRQVPARATTERSPCFLDDLEFLTRRVDNRLEEDSIIL